MSRRTSGPSARRHVRASATRPAARSARRASAAIAASVAYSAVRYRSSSSRIARASAGLVPPVDTAGPAARRPSTLRSATGPPPTTRQRRPASSRTTGKKPISAVHPVRREAGRDVALHHLNESAREPRAELLVGVARAELPEVLPGEALGEERAEQPLDRHADVRRGDAEPDRPRRGGVAAEGAADAEVVGVHERAVHLDLLALDAHVGDPVLSAAGPAPRHVELQVLVEARQPRLQLLHEGAREPLRLGEGELAELGARARDGPAPEGRGG